MLKAPLPPISASYTDPSTHGKHTVAKTPRSDNADVYLASPHGLPQPRYPLVQKSTHCFSPLWCLRVFTNTTIRCRDPGKDEGGGGEVSGGSTLQKSIGSLSTVLLLQPEEGPFHVHPLAARTVLSPGTSDIFSCVSSPPAHPSASSCPSLPHPSPTPSLFTPHQARSQDQHRRGSLSRSEHEKGEGSGEVTSEG